MAISRSAKGLVRMAVLLGQVLAPLASTASKAHAATCDADGNGLITVTDGVNVIRAAAGLPSSCTVVICDANDDGSVTLTDGVNTLRAAGGLSTSCDPTPSPTSTPGTIGDVTDVVAGARGGNTVPDFFGQDPTATLEIGIAPLPTTSTVADVAFLPSQAVAVPNAVRPVLVTTGGADAGVAAPAAVGHSLLVAARRPDGTDVPGYFRLPVVAESALVGVQFPNDLTASQFTLRFALEVDAGVTQYADVPLTTAAATRALAFIQSDLDPNAPIGPDGLTVSPDGAHVYVGSSENVSVFQRNQADGTVTLLQRVNDGGAADADVSPLGDNVYVVRNIGVSLLTVYGRLADGRLQFVEQFQDDVGGIDGLQGSVGVLVTPDGANVYAFGNLDSSVAVFQRNAQTGSLTFVERFQFFAGCSPGLPEGSCTAGALEGTITADGRYLYVPNFGSAVVVLARDPADGTLQVAQEVVDGVGGVEGIRRADGVALSRDERHLYVTGYEDGTVVTFARNAADGSLTFLRSQKEVFGAFSVLVSADDEAVYVIGSSSINVFAREPTTGLLTLRQSLQDGVDGVTEILGARRGAVFGPSVYIGCFGGDRALNVFRQNG